jgi:hypothetical protein
LDVARGPLGWEVDGVLFLISIQAARSGVEPLWSAVLEIAVGLEGADAFTIDSTTQAGRSGSESSEDLAFLRSLGMAVDDRRRDLRPIDGHLEILKVLGDRVLSIDLYAQRQWVAGISDWGDDIAALFEEAHWRKLRDVVGRLEPPPKVDVAEVTGRPEYSA